MHGGVYYKREKHGGNTLRALEKRRRERSILKEMKEVSKKVLSLQMD
jgi:hypothetical protein